MRLERVLFPPTPAPACRGCGRRVDESGQTRAGLAQCPACKGYVCGACCFLRGGAHECRRPPRAPKAPFRGAE